MNGLLVVLGCVAATSALADRTITVDGNDVDWTGASTCFSERAGDGSGGIDLTRACVSNDNASGDLGKLYLLFTAASLPKNQDLYFGFAIDLDGDGKIQSGADEVYAVVYPRGGSGISLSVYDAGKYTWKRSYTSTASCGGSPTSDGWQQAKVGLTIELSISYGCIRYGQGQSLTPAGPSLSYGTDKRQFQMGVFPFFDTTQPMFYDGTVDALYAPGTVPPVAWYPTVTSRSGLNHVFWTNPTEHEGTLVVRSVAPVSFTPTNGTRYSVGQTVGNGKVVFADGQGLAQSFTDTGLNNGTRYYYKVYNHNAGFTYASGDTPAPTGIFGEPRAAAATEPVWCYSTSISSLQQPSNQKGASISTAGNGGALVGLASSNGDELWRPTSVGGASQSKFASVPLAGRAGNYFIVGSQSGKVSIINAATGSPALTVQGSAFGGDLIQAFIPVQLYAYADSAFQAANPGPRDLMFVPTRITGSSNYKVVALSTVNGAKVWESGPMPPIQGGMLVDYGTNRLYVPTTGANPGSLKILSTISGAQIGTLNVGPVSRGVAKDYYWNGNKGQLIVVNDQGQASGFDLNWTSTPPPASWTVNIGAAPASLPLPIPNGFVVTTKKVGATPGRLQQYTFTPGGGSATAMRSIDLDDPTGAWFETDSTNHIKRVWVGNSDLKIHGIDFTTWADVIQIPTLGSRPGTPMVDPVARRLIVGLEDGRICSFALPP